MGRSQRRRRQKLAARATGGSNSSSTDSSGGGAPLYGNGKVAATSSPLPPPPAAMPATQSSTAQGGPLVEGGGGASLPAVRPTVLSPSLLPSSSQPSQAAPAASPIPSYSQGFGQALAESTLGPPSQHEGISTDARSVLQSIIATTPGASFEAKMSQQLQLLMPPRPMLPQLQQHQQFGQQQLGQPQVLSIPGMSPGFSNFSGAVPPSQYGQYGQIPAAGGSMPPSFSQAAPGYAGFAPINPQPTPGFMPQAPAQGQAQAQTSWPPTTASTARPPPTTATTTTTKKRGQGKRDRAREERERDPIVAPSAASGGIPNPSPDYLDRASNAPARVDERKPLLVVMDLNGTLLYRPNKRHPRHFVARPHADTFLNYITSRFWVVVWSSARSANVGAMVEALFKTPEQHSRLVAVWSRSDFGLTKADFERRVQCYKRLSKIWADDRIAAAHPDFASRGTRWGQADTVLVDDSVEKARSEPHNLICVPEFAGDTKERPVLPMVHDYLNVLCYQKDVSTFIRAHPFDAANPGPGIGMSMSSSRS